MDFSNIQHLLGAGKTGLVEWKYKLVVQQMKAICFLKTGSTSNFDTSNIVEDSLGT